MLGSLLKSAKSEFQNCFSFSFSGLNNQQQQQQQQQSTPLSQQQIQSSSDTGAITRTPARFPEDVTALADRDNVGRDLTRDSNKNAVTKTYHTLKDLISSKFKKDSLGDRKYLNGLYLIQCCLNVSIFFVVQLAMN